MEGEQRTIGCFSAVALIQRERKQSAVGFGTEFSADETTNEEFCICLSIAKRPLIDFILTSRRSDPISGAVQLSADHLMRLMMAQLIGLMAELTGHFIIHHDPIA